MGALAALLLWTAPAAVTDTLAGMYETSQMEVAAGLDLQPNGHFRYALDYGAVSEAGEGEWTSDGLTVVLTSNPMPPALKALELGNARFDRETLSVEDGDLLLRRYDTVFRFRRVRP
jgi:hypothetical protein